MSDKPAGTGSGPGQDSPRASFRTSLLAAGKTATGIEVPPEVIEQLGAGQRPPVPLTWLKPSATTMRHAGSSTGYPPARRNGTSNPSKAP